MLLIERIKSSETHQFRIVFSNSLNDNGKLFGGMAMQWMDEVAYITAIRFARKKVVTISVEKLKFLKAICVGSIIEIIGRVIKAGNVKIYIQMEIYIEKSDSDIREKAIEATFTFAAVDTENRPICIENAKTTKPAELIHSNVQDQLPIPEHILA